MFVALNITKAYAQVAMLKQQSAAASHSARILSAYKSELLQSWAGIEVSYLIKTIDAQIHACKKLSEESDSLSHNIARAIEDILREESADDTEALSG